MNKLFLAGENPSTDLLEKCLIFKTLVEFSSESARLSGLAKKLVFGPGIPEQFMMEGKQRGLQSRLGQPIFPKSYFH